MLRCRNLTVRPEGDAAAAPLLHGVAAEFRPHAMNAIIGPSGCGKTMLVKAMLGLVPVDAAGEVWLDQERITRPEELLGRVAFAPQFSIAQAKLTVDECLRYGLELTVNDPQVRSERLEHVLEVIGLAQHRHKRVESLSGGQLRRLGLGLELLVDPPTLICDEVTSGLDPFSESNILDLLRGLCVERSKTLLCIIHNLAKLDYFDWITVLNAGDVVFQGTLADMLTYFGIADALRLYDALNSQPQAHWRERWSAGEGRAGGRKSGGLANAGAGANAPSIPGGRSIAGRDESIFDAAAAAGAVVLSGFGLPVAGDGDNVWVSGDGGDFRAGGAAADYVTAVAAGGDGGD